MKLDYDSVSPITGNKCVVEEANPHNNSVSYLCMESGFTSNEELIEGTQFQEKYEMHLTELMLSCKIIDDDNRAWYPTFMQLPGAMLYAEGQSSINWNWKVAQIVPIIGDERLQYPMPGKENEYHTSRLDVENAKTYDKHDFKMALDDLYLVVKQVYNDNKNQSE